MIKSTLGPIYSGPLGQHSESVIEYFESISVVPRIRSHYNPATWMMEVTSTSAEVQLDVDFAHIYKKSVLYERNKNLATNLSSAPPGSKSLDFPTRFSQNAWGQFKCCLWKVNLTYWRSPSYNLIRCLTYWRSPSYNLIRCLYTLATSLFFGILFWGHGRQINDQEDLFIMFGSIFVAIIFWGINNCSAVIPYVSTYCRSGVGNAIPRSRRRKPAPMRRKRVN